VIASDKSSSVIRCLLLPVIVCLDVFSEEGDQGLCEGITEDKFWADNKDLCDEVRGLANALERNRESTFGVKPLKKAVEPSFLRSSLITVTPCTLRSKFAFCIRVFTVSSGAATVIEATAPATEAMKFCIHVAFE